MSDDGNHQFGMSRRELERECRWITRHVKNDQMVKLLLDVIVALIDKNNARIAKHHGRQDDKPGAP